MPGQPEIGLLGPIDIAHADEGVVVDALGHAAERSHLLLCKYRQQHHDSHEADARRLDLQGDGHAAPPCHAAGTVTGRCLSLG